MARKNQAKGQYKVTERSSKGDKYQRESWGRPSANLISDNAFHTAEDHYGYVDKEGVNPTHWDSDQDGDND